MEPSSGGETALRPALGPVAIDARRLDAGEFTAVLRALDAPRFGWATPDYRVAAGGAAVTLSADGADRFDRLRRGASALFERVETPPEFPRAARPRLVGGVAFHDDHDPRTDGPWRDFPAGLFVLPAVQFVRRADRGWLTVAATGPGARERAADRLDRWTARIRALPDRRPPEPPGVTDTVTGTAESGSRWRERVRAIRDRMTESALEKVVLARERTIDLDRPPAVPEVLARLGERYPDCTKFLVEPEGAGAFFGATPERLVSVDDRSVRTAVLAGSIARGETDVEDEELAATLRESVKNSREHEVVAESIRDRLEPLVASVRVADRDVRKLATVQHLETPVDATLDRDRHVLELVEALHPTPAVGGMPRAAALEAIGEHEDFDRGWYAAPVGWFDADGDGEFSVAIRSAIARGTTLALFAGNGIVADSDPADEWAELQLKYRPILDELA